MNNHITEIGYLTSEAITLGDAWPEFWPVIEDCTSQLEPDAHLQNITKTRLIATIMGDGMNLSVMVGSGWDCK